MKPHWKNMKAIISAGPRHADLYMSVIDEEGFISSANSHMLKDLELDNPKRVKTNFFDLLHPIHVPEFKKIVEYAGAYNEARAMELYIRNGHYHPMKWQVNYLQPTGNSSKKVYFCIGYKIIDEDRLKIFNKLLEKHYQLIMEGLTGIIFHDKQGELIAANQQTASLLNTSLERLYQLKNISHHWDTQWKISNEKGEPVPFDQAPFMKALQTGKTQKEILRIQLANGEYRWVLFNSQLLPDDHVDGVCCYVVSNIMDVTNEKLLTDKVEEKTAVINGFMNFTPNLAWVVDEDYRLIFASDAFFQYFGIDEKHALNERLSELLPPSVFKLLFEKHTEVFGTGKPLKTMERVKLADGTNHISHINIFPIDTPSGIRMVAGHAINLSDKTKIEAELREANERLLTLNKAASDAIWEWDMQTGKIFRNDALMEMIGFHTEEIKGLSWWLRRIHPEDRNRVSDKVKEATEEHQHSWQDEYRFKCADGQYKHIQDKGFIIYENGLPVKMIGSLHDISDLKELETKLSDEKLKQQKEISETVIRVQEKERTRIGHELHDNINQILSSSLLFVDMLIPEGKEQKQLKGKGVQYITMAIEEIRKLSKELVIPQIKEEGLVNSIQSLIEDIHLVNNVRIKFTHDLESDLLSSSKKITLFRIVQEQLKNIITHSKAKSAEILLQSKQENLELIIKDNGIGFDPKQTHRGIGLSNIYERVSFYDGKVEIETAKGKGCMISVSIPLQ